MSSSFQFHVTFSQAWILTQRGNDVLPVNWFISEIKKRYNVSEIKSKLTECEGLIEVSENDNKDSLRKQLSEIIVNKYDIKSNENVFTIELSEYTEPELTAEPEPKPEPKPEKAAVQIPEEKPSEPEVQQEQQVSALEKIRALVGADEFKALAEECSRIAEGLKNNSIVDSFTSRSYVISINEGCGLSTYLELFADLVSETGLFNFPSKSRISEVALRPYDAKNESDAFTAALSCFQSMSRGKIVCIDISEWMTKLTEKPFRNFLRKIDEHTGENIVFFRVPFVERNIVKEIESSINDIIFAKGMSITPFSSEELVQCAENIITQKNFSMAPESWEIFNLKVAAEKSDGRFYGINTVNKIIREMLYAKQLYNVEHSVDDKLIKRNEITGIIDNEYAQAANGYDQLAQLIGIESIIDRIKEVVSQIEAALSNDSLDTPCIHMRFVGNPGTGKTTVARILGTILKEKGILRNGCFFEHFGRELCGRFVGETAPKTAAICRDAYGSVLFIDEAYSLYRDDGLSSADYGKEAIDTLVAEMENHRTDLMVIMAGYPDDMEKLMNGNVGLKSRMPYLIEFPNYTREQLAEIFMSMAKKGFSYDSSFSDAVRSYFDSLSGEVMDAKDFSNARFVRNLFERTWGKAALRCQMNHIPCNTLTVEDLALATSDKEFHNIMDHKKRTIGFDLN